MMVLSSRPFLISPVIVDTIPDAFGFTDQTNVTISTVITSASVTITGINTASPITVSGGTYSINGGAFTSSAGTILNGNTVQARHTSSASNSTATNTVVTIGGVSDTFTSTTEAASTFDFYASPTGSDANPGTQVSPWAYTALFSKAATYAGKRLGFLNGTYDMSGASGAGTNLGDQGAAKYIPSAASGTAGTHTVIQSVNPLGAVIKCFDGVSTYFNSSGPGAPSMWECQANYVDIIGFEFTASAGHGVTFGSGVHDVDISYCWIHDHNNNRHTTQADSNMGGVYFRGSSPNKDSLSVRYCKIHDIIGKSGDPNAVGDQFGSSNVLIDHCTIFDVATLSYWKVNATSGVIRYCHVYNCNLLAETWSTGAGGTNEIYGNILHGNCFGYVQSANNNGNAAAVCNVYNNTILMRPSSGWSSTYYGSTAGSNPGNAGGYITITGGGAGVVNFYNNAVLLDASLTLSSMIAIFSPSAASATRLGTWDYNRYTRFTVADSTTTNHDATTLATWQGFGYDTHSPVVGVLTLVNEAQPSVIASMAPDTGSALLAAGLGGINIGHTGLGVTPGCGF